MAELFNVTVENIRQHLKNLFNDNELDENSVCKKILHAGSDGKMHNTFFYELDAIIAVGYRANSKKDNMGLTTWDKSPKAKSY